MTEVDVNEMLTVYRPTYTARYNRTQYWEMLVREQAREYLECSVVRDHNSSVEGKDEYQPIPIRLEAGVVKNDVSRSLGNLLTVVRNWRLVSNWHRLNNNQHQVSLNGCSALKGKKKGKCTVSRFIEKLHDRATECHSPYGITQCYLLPDTSERTPPSPQPDTLVLDLPTI